MIYLDLDMDYFVKPVFTNSVNGIRIYKDELCEVSNIYDFFNKLKQKVSIPEEKHIFTNHKKSYIYWWIKRNMGNTLIHIDAHSDLYRNKQMDLRYLDDIDMNCDDYIWYALREGFIDEIYWVCPENMIDFNDQNTVNKMFCSAMIQKVQCSDKCLDIEFKIIRRDGTSPIIKYHLLEIDSLPVFTKKPSLLTFATSPEFVPSAADCLLDDIQSILNFENNSIQSIKKLHNNMPMQQVIE